MNKHGQFSIIPARSIYDKRLDTDDRDVLNCLGLYADRDGWCYPNQRTIGNILGKSRSFISNRISHLEKCGYVIVIEQRNVNTNAQIGNKYRVIHDAALEPEFDRSLEEESEYKTGSEDTPVLNDAQMKTPPVLEQARSKTHNVIIERPTLSSEKSSDDTFQDFYEKPEKRVSEHKQMIGVLANVTRANSNLVGAKLGVAAARLLKAGYHPHQVKELYSRGGAYYKYDWRGKKGELPTIASINDSIARLLKEDEKSEVVEV